jgi:Spy/CpxP family protein refolding chaperone
MRLTQRIPLFLLATALAQAQAPSPASFPMNAGHPSSTPFGGPGGKPPIPFSNPGGTKWWNNPEMIRRLGLTPEQQKKMDEVLQQSRLRLIDLTAALEKDEVEMEGLMRGPQLDDAKILPEVDRIAQARAELEKANARMMLGIRHVLSPEQWEKLSYEESRSHRGPGSHGPGGPPPLGPPGGPPPGGSHGGPRDE